jgi:hypothetical protein
MMNYTYTKLTVVLLCGALAAGCSDPTVGKVSGTITVDGEPAETGFIGFMPVDGESGSEGAPITDGAYEATIPLGKFRVQIRVPKVVGEKKLYDTPDSIVSPVMAEALPPWYNDDTELEIEVVSGETTKDFELSTKMKRR